MSEASEPPAAEREARWGLLSTVVLVGVALDQIGKQLAEAFLRGRGLVSVVDGFFDLRYARNPGAFFSLGADLAPPLRRTVFVVASIAAVALIVRLYAQAERAQVALRWALMLLLAGALGNLVDRVVHGEVIDFVHLYWRGVFDWATFNVADALIVAGLALLVVDLFRSRPAPASGRASEPHTEGSV
jgi:signal peptidase II